MNSPFTCDIKLIRFQRKLQVIVTPGSAAEEEMEEPSAEGVILQKAEVWINASGRKRRNEM